MPFYNICDHDDLMRGLQMSKYDISSAALGQGLFLFLLHDSYSQFSIWPLNCQEFPSDYSKVQQVEWERGSMGPRFECASRR